MHRIFLSVSRPSKVSSLLKILLLSAVMAGSASANEFELSRIANELSAVSDVLARESRYSRGFGSVGQRADRLARDSAQLVDAIARRRSSSYIRAQYADVSGRYSDLEDAYFRASRNYSNDQVYIRVSMISALFSDLSEVYYYSPVYTSRTPVVTLVNPGVVQRQRLVPNVFRGNSGMARGRHSRDVRFLDQRGVRQRGYSQRTAQRERGDVGRGHRSTGKVRVGNTKGKRVNSGRRRVDW